MFNKDVTHPRMRRKIVRPRVLLLDCPLEYKKGDSNANVEITKEEDWNTLLRIEEEYIEHVCAQIVAARPDVVITEKGVSDLAQHYLMKANITAFRRLRKTDNNRVAARATGATICSRTDEIQESDVGTQCGLFEVRKLGDEYFAFLKSATTPRLVPYCCGVGRRTCSWRWNVICRTRCRSSGTWSSSRDYCRAAARRRWPSPGAARGGRRSYWR